MYSYRLPHLETAEVEDMVGSQGHGPAFDRGQEGFGEC